MKSLIKWLRQLPHKHQWEYHPTKRGHLRECKRCGREEILLIFNSDNRCHVDWFLIEREPTDDS
jgi:hypothetical protein